jgi:plasmid stabilization system protein ParE
MRLTSHLAVAADLAVIRDWYVAQNPGLAGILLADIKATVERILRHPRMYIRVVGDVHRVQLVRFPCHIYYVVRDSDLYIVAVSDSRAEPSATLAKVATRLS